MTEVEQPSAGNDTASPPTADLPSFTELGLCEPLLTALTEAGFSDPTPVQAQAIPVAIAGSDLLVQSRTGTGKTAAYLLPVCEQLKDAAADKPRVLILGPTRELALQVSEAASQLAEHLGLKVATLYGGANIQTQIRALRSGVHIVSGTPGRILDHLRRKTFDPSSIAHVVLDECDEMLSMGFIEDVTAILQQMPKKRQTLLFSATISVDIERFADRFLDSPEEIRLSSDAISAREIEHAYYLVGNVDRFDLLRRVLEHEDPAGAIVFCNTRDETGKVTAYLKNAGVKAEGISGDLSQRDREQVMKQMKDKELQVLVATDIAARGIDIADLSHVINFAFPESSDAYVHRTGRTARAGKSGIALSFVGAKEIGSLHKLRTVHKIYPGERSLPKSKDTLVDERADLKQVIQRYGSRSATDQKKNLLRRILVMPEGRDMLGVMLDDLLKQETRRQQARPAERADAAPRSNRSPTTSADSLAQNPRSGSSSRTRSNEQPAGTRLYVGLGSENDALDEAKLIQLISEKTSFAATDLDRVRICDHFSFVSVAPDRADALLAELGAVEVDGKRLRVERAKESKPRPPNRRSTGRRPTGRTRSS